jgi:hypothetical protein
MVGVGIWASQRGGKAVWLLPLAFIIVMALGGIIGVAAITIPFVERAQSGVGTLRLIDDEKLECGNVHRHFLGARFINESKPRGLMVRLTEDYPLPHRIAVHADSAGPAQGQPRCDRK